jgi:hypothetical protein
MEVTLFLGKPGWWYCDRLKIVNAVCVSCVRNWALLPRVDYAIHHSAKAPLLYQPLLALPNLPRHLC